MRLMVMIMIIITIIMMTMLVINDIVHLDWNADGDDDHDDGNKNLLSGTKNLFS